MHHDFGPLCPPQNDFEQRPRHLTLKMLLNITRKCQIWSLYNFDDEETLKGSFLGAPKISFIGSIRGSKKLPSALVQYHYAQRSVQKHLGGLENVQCKKSPFQGPLMDHGWTRTKNFIRPKIFCRTKKNFLTKIFFYPNFF